MSIAAGTTRLGRVQAEALMTAAVVIKRDSGDTTEDPVSLEEVAVYDTIYTGKARLKMGTSQGTGAIPGAVIIETSATLSLPVEGSGLVLPNDVVVFTANPLDTSLVGRQLRVTAGSAQTYATARRFPVEWVS
jgi:hypothetical protein